MCVVLCIEHLTIGDDVSAGILFFSWHLIHYDSVSTGILFFSWHLIHYNSVSTGILFSMWHLIHYDSVSAGMYLFFSWHLIHYNSVSAVIPFFNSHLINFNSVSAGVVLCSLLILSCHFKFTTDMKTPQRIITRNIHVMFNFYFVKRIKKKPVCHVRGSYRLYSWSYSYRHTNVQYNDLTGVFTEKEFIMSYILINQI
jgi:hypothetical protein